MVSDDERRRVAERLRMSDERDAAGFIDCLLAEMIRGREFCETPCEECHARLLGELADLIDPTCLARADVEDTPDGGQFECWSCSVCGAILSVDPDYDTETDGPTYCEMCGHRIIGKGEPTWL